MTGEYLKGTGTGNFPKPIKWKKINKLFSNYDFDGLLVLETFDSESFVLNGGLIEKIRIRNKKKVKEKVVQAFLNIEVQAGWRIYDIVNHLN